MRLRFRSLAVPVLISAFVLPASYATTTYSLPSWMGSSYLATAPTIDTSASLSITTTAQVNNGFTAAGTTTQPVLGVATTLNTVTAQNMTVLSPSPAPAQIASSNTPWWMSFSTFGTSTPVISQTPMMTPMAAYVSGISTVGQTVQPFDTIIPADVPIPEPATLSIFAAGLGCLWSYRRRILARRE